MISIKTVDVETIAVIDDIAYYDTYTLPFATNVTDTAQIVAKNFIMFDVDKLQEIIIKIKKL